MFSGDAALCRWIRLAGERVAFQGLPARIFWLGYGERARFGLAINDLVRQAVEYATSRGRRCIFLLTYHWSKGERHRGCYGFQYNRDAAQRFIFSLRKQVEYIFGEDHTVVYPVCMGIETDEDAYMLHGANGKSLNLADWDPGRSIDDLRVTIERMYPDMHRDFVRDLLPILTGNVTHIAKVRGENRPLGAMDHRERAIVLGRGVGWLHEPNYALIIGPYVPNLVEPIVNAAKIVQRNLEEERIPVDEGALLMTSAPFRDFVGIEPRLAMVKARTLASFAYETIRRELPKLYERLDVLAGIVDLNTQKYSQIDWEPASRT